MGLFLVGGESGSLQAFCGQNTVLHKPCLPPPRRAPASSALAARCPFLLEANKQVGRNTTCPVSTCLRPAGAQSPGSLRASRAAAGSWKAPGGGSRDMWWPAVLISQVSGPGLALVSASVKWPVWTPQIKVPSSSEIAGTTSHIQKSPWGNLQAPCLWPWILTLTLGSLAGAGADKLLTKGIPQKRAPTCLSHSANRKPTSFPSEDHPACPPPSTSCKNAFMKPPQSQGQRAAPCGGTQAANPEKGQCSRVPTPRKNHPGNLPWEKAFPE